MGALQGLALEHVVYAGTASKTLAPALRLGWLVVPAWLIRDVAEEKDLADRGTPVLEQAALADLLTRGDVERHLCRTRRRYRARRDALVTALGRHLPQATISGAAAGLHLVVELPSDNDEMRIAAAARERGVAVEALRSTCTVVAPRPPTLLLGYAALPEAALERAVAELAHAAAGVATR